MDKIVTFIGFIQNAVAPSKRNRNSNRTSRSSARVFNDSFPRASASFRKDSFDSGFNSANGGLEDTAPSGENKMNRTKACAFTEQGLDTLRGEVREIEPLRCGPSKRSANMSFDGGLTSAAVLPPAVIPMSSETLHGDLSEAVGKDTPAGVDSKMEGDSKNKANLPSLQDSRLLSPGKQHKNQTKDRKGLKQCKDLTNKASLPDIFSNAGKSFVEVNQLSAFKRMSFRKTTAVKVRAEASTIEPASKEEAIGNRNGRKSRLKVPIVKLKSKNGKDGSCKEYAICQAEQVKNTKEQTVPAQGVKIFYEDNNRFVSEKGGERGTMKNGKGGLRPGTALGKWIKRHGNKVAPAPLDDLASDAEKISPTEQALVQKEKKIQKKARSETIVPYASIGVDEETLALDKREKQGLTISSKTALTDGEDEKRGSSRLKACEKVYTMRDKSFNRATSPENEVTRLSPLNSSFYKETLKELPLKENDNDSQKTQPKKQDRVEDSIFTRKDNANFSEDSDMFGVYEELGRKSRLPDLPSLVTDHYSQPFPTKRIFKKISENLIKSEDDSLKLDESGPHDTKHIDVVARKKECKQRVVPDDSKVQNPTTINVKREVVGCTEIGKLPLIHDPESQRLAKMDIRPERKVSPHEWSNSSAQNTESSVRALPSIRDFKNQKQVVLEKTPSSATDCPRPLLYIPARGFMKLSKDLQQSMVLANSAEGLSTDNSVSKATFNGGKPCLPSIKTHNEQMVEEFLAKQKLKQMKQQEMENDFEGWDDEEEPEVIKQILERPVTAKIPRYPAHWGPLPNERPPGRGGEGYCLGVIWRNTGKINITDSSSEGMFRLCHGGLQFISSFSLLFLTSILNISTELMRSGFFLGSQPETIETRLLLFRVISPLQSDLENNNDDYNIYIFSSDDHDNHQFSRKAKTTAPHFVFIFPIMLSWNLQYLQFVNKIVQQNISF